MKEGVLCQHEQEGLGLGLKRLPGVSSSEPRLGKGKPENDMEEGEDTFLGKVADMPPA